MAQMHNPGDPIECFGLPFVLHKEPEFNERGQHTFDADGNQRFRCGFRIGGGIDQDPAKSPQGYPDNGVYITLIYEGSPAHNAGLMVHDKILQVNGHDLTMATHKKATDYIRRKPVLNMLIYRKGVPQQLPPQQQQQQQQINQHKLQADQNLHTQTGNKMLVGNGFIDGNSVVPNPQQQFQPQQQQQQQQQQQFQQQQHLPPTAQQMPPQQQLPSQQQQQQHQFMDQQPHMLQQEYQQSPSY